MELPIFNWAEFHKESDVSWILKKKRKISFKEKIVLQNLWRKLYSEYIKEFGFRKDFEANISIEKEIALLRIEMALDGDGGKETLIEILESKKQLQNSETPKENFFKSKPILEKIFGRRINIHEETTYEYRNMIRIASEKKD